MGQSEVGYKFSELQAVVGELELWMICLKGLSLLHMLGNCMVPRKAMLKELRLVICTLRIWIWLITLSQGRKVMRVMLRTLRRRIVMKTLKMMRKGKEKELREQKREKDGKRKLRLPKRTLKTPSQKSLSLNQSENILDQMKRVISWMP